MKKETIKSGNDELGVQVHLHNDFKILGEQKVIKELRDYIIGYNKK